MPGMHKVLGSIPSTSCMDTHMHTYTPEQEVTGVIATPRWTCQQIAATAFEAKPGSVLCSASSQELVFYTRL